MFNAQAYMLDVGTPGIVAKSVRWLKNNVLRRKTKTYPANSQKQARTNQLN